MQEKKRQKQILRQELKFRKLSKLRFYRQNKKLDSKNYLNNSRLSSVTRKKSIVGLNNDDEGNCTKCGKIINNNNNNFKTDLFVSSDGVTEEERIVIGKFICLV